jgi:hypothetical protein
MLGYEWDVDGDVGNTVYLNTTDGNGLPWLPLPDSGMFGPANETWH